MNPTAQLRCRCGQVAGRVRDVSPRTLNRVVCLCDDCQAFAHHLGRSDVLDAQGGSDIVQVAPDTFTIDRGQDQIACLRLSEKGPYRFYSRCCRQPLGNTVGPVFPFIGIVISAFSVEGQSLDSLFGKPMASIYGNFAVGQAPPGSTGFPFRLMARSLRMVLGWKLGGHAWPHPFFDRTSAKPICPVEILPSEARAALRPLCGPRP